MYCRDKCLKIIRVKSQPYRNDVRTLLYTDLFILYGWQLIVPPANDYFSVSIVCSGDDESAC